jgi:hexosaminidase
MPSRLQLRAGRVFLSSRSPIFHSGQDEAKDAAEYLKGRLKAYLGPKAGGQRIRLELLSSQSSEESYKLSALPKQGVSIQAPSRAGLLLGIQTLLQLCISQKGRIPALNIEDQARFPWRGMLLDCCRHFYSVKGIKRLIDILALHKFNRFHWHLTEDQGWRLQIKKYPRLTKIGAWRFHAGDKPYGGFYTQAQVREVVRYAAQAGITVVPEIEMPGHSTAALAAYPELSCRGGSFKVRSEWGVHKDIYCAGNDKVFRFLQDVLDEVVELFPGAWIHVGADEAPKDRWSVCPKCQKRIKKEKLKDEFALQTWFVQKIVKYVASKGKTVIAWDEILEGGAPKGTLVQGWRGEGRKGPNAQAAKAGRQVLVSPYTHWYLNERTGLRKTWDLNPIPGGLSPKQKALIHGGECCVWTEGIPETDLDARVFPRALAVIEILWRGKERCKNFSEFLKRAQAHVGMLKPFGIQSVDFSKL